MEILWWLAPSAVVTAVAMLWVAWRGREHREVDRETAARRLGEALSRDPSRPLGAPAPRRTEARTNGVAVRRPGRPSPAPDADRRAS